ncbi:MAG: LamG-like jellyroll fold domain-containing protein, partial [Verrucomicrobiota bacterium]
THLHLMLRRDQKVAWFGVHIEEDNLAGQTSFIGRRDWRHLVFQYTGEHMQIWVDGRMDASRTAPPFNGSKGHFDVGRAPRWDDVKTRDWAGAMRHLRVYTRSLTEPEILGLFHREKPEEPDVPTPEIIYVEDQAPTDVMLLSGLRIHYEAPSLRSIQPLYAAHDHILEKGKVLGMPDGQVIQTRAKEGYAIGGILTYMGGPVGGLGVIYMKRIGHNRLDATDYYLSDWIGRPIGDHKVILLCGLGVPVFGITTRYDDQIQYLGVLHGTTKEHLNRPAQTNVFHASLEKWSPQKEINQ